MKRRLCSLLAFCLLMPFAASQQDPPKMPPVVMKALAAARKLCYSGTRNVMFRDGNERRSHTEMILKDGPRSRIWFPPGSPNYGQVIVENGPKRVQYMPGADKVVESASRGDDAVRRLAATIKNAARFRVTVTRGDRIAGLQTQKADITDRKGNCIQSLWIEPRTGMVLKRELYDNVGAVVGSFEFTSISFDPKVDPKDFQINRNAKFVKLGQQLKDECDRFGFEPYGLSKDSAYDLQAVRVLNAKGRVPMLMQAYSGAKGVVTLFQVNGRVDPKRLAKLARGNLNTYSWRIGDRAFVLVSEIDESQLERLAGLVNKL